MLPWTAVSLMIATDLHQQRKENPYKNSGQTRKSLCYFVLRQRIFKAKTCAIFLCILVVINDAFIVISGGYSVVVVAGSIVDNAYKTQRNVCDRYHTITKTLYLFLRLYAIWNWTFYQEVQLINHPALYYQNVVIYTAAPASQLASLVQLSGHLYSLRISSYHATVYEVKPFNHCKVRIKMVTR